MNIGYDAILLSGKFSGVHTYIYNLSKALAEVSPEDRFTMFLPRGFSKKLYKEYDNVKPEKAVISGKIRTFRIFWEQFWLPFKVVRYGFDIMHFPGYIHPMVKGIPTVLTVHDLNVIIAPELCRRANVHYYSRFLKKSIDSATRIITPTERVKNDVYRIFKKPKACIDVIPMGTDMPDLGAPEIPVREKYQIGSKPYVLFVGNFDPKKGLMFLIKGFFAAVTYKKLDINLVITGNKSWQFKKIRRLVSEFGEDFAKRVIFTGYADRKDLPGLYKEAQLLVSPSVVEGFGIPPLEAISCGTPVLLSSEPALSETYSDYAHFFKIADLKELREQLEILLTDPDQRGKYTAKAIDFGRKLTWKSAAEKTIETYQHAIRDFKKE